MYSIPVGFPPRLGLTYHARITTWRKLNSAHLRLGTRGSLLAHTQSGIVGRTTGKAHPGLTIEVITFKTSGDQIAERPLHEFGGKGLFTKELEQAMLDWPNRFCRSQL